MAVTWLAAPILCSVDSANVAVLSAHQLAPSAETHTELGALPRYVHTLATGMRLHTTCSKRRNQGEQSSPKAANGQSLPPPADGAAQAVHAVFLRG